MADNEQTHQDLVDALRRAAIAGAENSEEAVARGNPGGAESLANGTKALTEAYMAAIAGSQSARRNESR